MITYRFYKKKDREALIDIINQVAGRERSLQTEKYVPTPAWEKLLEVGVEKKSGNMLLVVCDEGKLAGFGRLSSEDQGNRAAGNVGIVLLPGYRSQGIGTKILKFIIGISTKFNYAHLTANILFDNEISLRLFRGQGFRKSSSRPIFAANRNEFVEEIKMQFSHINAEE
ncbi:MAG: GNAT family N-acetyltransferase [Anaerolineales bacterium]|nr:GNAT family N-acetyltransferase [Anaerolineales bacterium]